MFAVSFLLVVFGLRAFELTAGPALTAAAGAMLLISLALYAAAPRWAEGAALAGAAVLCRLPWLAALPVLLYAALGLDERLTDASATATAGSSRARYAGAAGYLLLIAAAAAVGATKQSDAGGPVLDTIRGLFIH